MGSCELVPLSSLLRDHIPKSAFTFTRQQRFEIAAILASSFLQMYSTPWSPPKWNKEEIYFVYNGQGPEIGRPYFKHCFEAQRAPTTSMYSPQMQTNMPAADLSQLMFSLGILLLELIFNQPIEQCPYRQLYYGPNNQPNDQTDASTARRWLENVLGECGPEMSDVIRRCLNCSFGPPPDFADKRFREAVYQCVVSPLESICETIWRISSTCMS